MAIRCQTCNVVFRNINERRKHAIKQTVCTSPALLEKRRLGKITQQYQRDREVDKKWRILCRDPH